MAKIESYPVLNFSGGVRRDKSLFQLQKNELLDARNVLVDEQGRIITRRGSQQFGTTGTGNIENSFVYVARSAGSSDTVNFIKGNNAAPATLYFLAQTRLTTSITTASTTVVVDDNTLFVTGGAGTVEIEGDLIAYTNTNGATQFTGCTGIRVSHEAGAAVHQFRTLSSQTNLTGTSGIYYVVIGGILILNGRDGVWQQWAGDTGAGTTNITGEPGGIFITNYRDRGYVAGDGSNQTNASPIRVSFSNRGTGLTWTSTDFFDVEDQRAELITGFKVNNDIFWIFKPSSIYSYDEIELKQRQTNVGAYNHKVIQEIDGLIYTFCPNGIFVGNGFQMKQIGEPVRQYWENFKPIFDAAAGGRVIINTFSGRFKNHYLLYIYDITDPDSTADVVLDYDTKQKVWTVHSGGFTDFFHFGSYERFLFGDRENKNITQYFPALFAGDSSGNMYRFFESRYIDGQSTSVVQGSDIFSDLVADSAGTPVSAVVEFPMYDLTHSNLYKLFKYLRVYVERGEWFFSYRVENELGISEYRPLGVATMTNRVLPFPSAAAGWRVGLRATSATTAHAPILNGFVFEDTEVIKRP